MKSISGIVALAAVLAASAAPAAIVGYDETFSTTGTEAGWYLFTATGTGQAIDRLNGAGPRKDWADNDDSVVQDALNTGDPLPPGGTITGDGMLADGGLMWTVGDATRGNERIAYNLGGTMEDGEEITLNFNLFNNVAYYNQVAGYLYDLTTGTQLMADPWVITKAWSDPAYSPEDGLVTYTCPSERAGHELAVVFREWHNSTNRVAYIDNISVTSSIPTRPVTVTIDRATGEISLESTGGVDVSDIVGYSVLSDAGSLDQSGWDQQTGGSQLANDDDDWTVLTAAGVTTDLSEVVLSTTGSGDGGDLLVGGAWSLGNVWTATPFEDIAVELALDDGTILTSANSDVRVVYTGTEALLGDIAGATVGDGPDGDIDLVDWAKFKAGMNTDVSALTDVAAYLEGDLTGDLLVDYQDFNAFQAAFNDANPITLAQAIAGVPEPSGVALLMLGLGAVLGTGLRKPMSKSMRSALTAGAVCAVTVLFFSSSAFAVTDYLLVSYDADAGNPISPAAIQSPEDQGWFEWASTIQGQDPTVAVQEGVIGNDSTNAWKNSDVGATNPGYGIDVDPSVQQAMFDFGWRWETVMTMTEGSHWFTYGVGVGNPWGLPETARIGFSTGVDDNSAVLFNPQDDGTAATITTPNNTAGDFYRVVINGDPQATSGTFEVFDFSSSTQVGSSEVFGGWVSSGNSNNNDVLGFQSGSSSGTGRTALIHSMDLVVPAPDTLTLQVNTTNGLVKLVNNSSATVSFNGYFIESTGGQLKTAGWASLESVDLDGNGVPDDGIGWEAFDTLGSDFLAEGYLTGESTLGPGGSLSLGLAYDPSIAGVGNDGDLDFKLTDASGRTVSSSLFGTVEYVTGSAGDLDGDGDVDLADLMVWQRTDGSAAGLSTWQSSFTGSLVEGGAVTAVPEPGTGMLLLLGGALAGVCFSGRNKQKGVHAMGARFSGGRTASALVSFVAVLLYAGTAGATQVDRDYTLGDGGEPGATANGTVGSVSYDNAGSLGAGDLQDLNVSGSPIYRAVSGSTGRPGALSGDLGIEFDGSDDVLFTSINMNRPTDMWDNETFFPGPPPAVFPHNYEGIESHGIQLWAKPTVTGSRQDLVVDTQENGLYITENNTWGLVYDFAPGIDSGISVASTLDVNGWVHVMQLAGLPDVQSGSSRADGALLVNGVAVAGRIGNYDTSTAALSIGASVELDESGFLLSSSNHYTGQLDDVRVFFWGDNSDELGYDGAPGGTNNNPGDLNADGQDWGALNLAVDNDWIAQKLAALAVTAGVDSIPVTDLDFDGDTDAADEAIFIANWRNENVVGGVRVGDWISRQKGDFNYDGITDLADAFLIHDQLAPLGGLHFSRLGVVPEPGSAALVLIGVTLLGGVCRGRRA